MSRPAIKWGELERLLLRLGFTITPTGGDKMIRPPKHMNSGFVMRIGHTSTSKPGSHVLVCYLSKIKNRWGIDVWDELGK